MSTVRDEILKFAKDAQFRIGELTTEIYNLPKNQNDKRIELQNLRHRLSNFLQVIITPYSELRGDSINIIKNISSHLLLSEMEYLRVSAGMNIIPHTETEQQVTQLITLGNSSSNSSSSSDLPIGPEGHILIYTATGSLTTVSLYNYFGFRNETAAVYFSTTNRRVGQAVFTHDELTSLNPLLRPGEIIFVKEGSTIVQKKVGGGLYNSLPFIEDNYVREDTPVTNKIGGLPDNLQGLNLKEIILKAFASDVDPLIKNILNNASGVFEESSVLEIGSTLPINVNFTYEVENSAFALASEPITIDANPIFTNQENRENTGALVLSTSSGFNPTTLTSLDIILGVKNTDNVEVSTSKSTILFSPRIYWGSTSTETLNTPFPAMDNQGSIVNREYRRSYYVPGQGYKRILIPNMLITALTEPVFYELLNGYIPFPIDMVSEGTVSINTGLATYDYQSYRTKYRLLSETYIKIEH